MSTVQEKAASASARSKEILPDLPKLERAPSLLKQSEDTIWNIKEQIKASETSYSALEGQREAYEHKQNHHTESSISKLAHKATGRSDKFKEKAGKESENYEDVTRRANAEKEKIAKLKQSLEEEEKKRNQIKADSDKYNELQGELEGLFNPIFQGSATEFPEQKKAEERVRTARIEFDKYVMLDEAGKQVLEHLNKARTALESAASQMHSSHGWAAWDVMGGGAISNYKRGNNFDKAADSFNEARKYVGNANAANRELMAHDSKTLTIEDIGPLYVEHATWGEQCSTNYEWAYYDNTKSAETNLTAARQTVGKEIEAAWERQAKLQAQVETQAKELAESRRQLVHLQSEAVIKMAA